MKRRAVVWIVLALFCLLVVAAGWVRLAPVDAASWHQELNLPLVEKKRNGAVRLVDGDAALLARLDEIIRQAPRTRVLAGSPADGMVTYVTRSAVFAFPDITTVHLRDGRLEIHGRARYGLSDLGVNAARIDGWLEALRQGG